MHNRRIIRPATVGYVDCIHIRQNFLGGQNYSQMLEEEEEEEEDSA